jgi:hypothetical protein
VIITSYSFHGVEFEVQAHVTIGSDGQARVDGRSRLHDGTSNTIMLAEGHPDMSCGNLDHDDIAGLTGAVIDFRATRSGQLFTATVLPTNGEADALGRHAATVTFTGGGRTLTADGTLVIQRLSR